MKLALLLLLASQPLHFDVTDERGRKVSVAIEAGEADSEGFRELRIVKGKPGTRIVWPFDRMARETDGPGAVPVTVSAEAQPAGPHAAAAALLRAERCEGSHFASSSDSFTRGVALLCANKPSEAAEPLSQALRERERQLTRVPSEIFGVAMLDGQALLQAGKFDEAAVAFLKALRQRPSNRAALQYRAEALRRSGKPEAAAQLP